MDLTELALIRQYVCMFIVYCLHFVVLYGKSA